ncbi:hypothetical protein Ancab_039045 [Ancistrocladus abbreviatus]
MAATPTSSPSSTFPLKDRVAIVTGSSRGIGKVVALHLASLGAKLVVNYLSSAAKAEEVVREINSSWSATSSFPRAIAVQADVSNPAQVKSLFDAAEKAFQEPAHILIANAGIIDPTFPLIADTTVESLEKTLNVNTKGTFLCIREAANRLKRGGGGRIITYSFTPTKGEDGPGVGGAGAFLASTAAIEEMTKIIAKELKGTKITANCVALGAFATEAYFSIVDEEFVKKCINFSPLLRLGEPRDVAVVLGFLVSDDGEWVNGQVIPINGGA